MEDRGESEVVAEVVTTAPTPRVLPSFGHRRLRGTFPLKFDRSARIAIPAPVRHPFAVGDAEAVLTPLSSHHLGLWAPYAFEVFLAAGLGDPTREIVSPRSMRWLEMESRDVSIDAQYRIVVPPELRGEVDLGTEIVVAGASDRLEIWQRAAFEAERGEHREVRGWANNREVLP